MSSITSFGRTYLSLTIDFSRDVYVASNMAFSLPDIFGTYVAGLIV